MNNQILESIRQVVDVRILAGFGRNVGCPGGIEMSEMVDTAWHRPCCDADGSEAYA